MKSPLWKFTSSLLAACLSAAICLANEPPFSLPPKGELAKLKSGVIYTNRGNIYIELFPEDAPWHVANLKYLADSGFYRNVRFNWFEPGYLIQVGGPGPKINSGPGYTLPPEFNSHKHVRGVLSMVRKPNELDYEHSRRSHGSQFRILMKTESKMDGYFVIFGRVVKGMEVVESLGKNDYIKDLQVFVRKKPSRSPTTVPATPNS